MAKIILENVTSGSASLSGEQERACTKARGHHQVASFIQMHAVVSSLGSACALRPVLLKLSNFSFYPGFLQFF